MTLGCNMRPSPQQASAPEPSPAHAPEQLIVQWQQDGQTEQALWHSEAGVAAPEKLILVDDQLTAERAFQLASQGQFMLWQGDFHQAKQILSALTRRCNKRMPSAQAIAPDSFHRYRMAQAQRARLLGRILLLLQPDGVIALRRAPDVQQACQQVLPPCQQNRLISLREILSLIAAYEWRKKGVWIDALQAQIYPFYGVYSPIRGEYLSLLAQAPLENLHSAMDIGTGTGVIAALLARRGISNIIATDCSTRALACAEFNLQQLGLLANSAKPTSQPSKGIQLMQSDLFPADRSADLIVCNPPWLPAKPSSPVEYAVYDYQSQMLRGFLAGAKAHLNANGEVWLVMSNLAELLLLRPADALPAWIAQSGFKLVQKLDAQAQHAKAADASDMLYEARRREVTSLYRLKVI